MRVLGARLVQLAHRQESTPCTTLGPILGELRLGWAGGISSCSHLPLLAPAYSRREGAERDAGCPGGDVPEQPVGQHPGVSCLLSKSSQRAHGDGAEHGGSAPGRSVFPASGLQLTAVKVRGWGRCCGMHSPQHTLSTLLRAAQASLCSMQSSWWFLVCELLWFL